MVQVILSGADPVVTGNAIHRNRLHGVQVAAELLLLLLSCC